MVPLRLKLRVNMARSAAVRSVTADIFKGTGSVATWTYFWWSSGLNGIPAFQTFPKRIHVFCCRCLRFFCHDFTLYLFVLFTWAAPGAASCRTKRIDRKRSLSHTKSACDQPLPLYLKILLPSSWLRFRKLYWSYGPLT